MCFLGIGPVYADDANGFQINVTSGLIDDINLTERGRTSVNAIKYWSIHDLAETLVWACVSTEHIYAHCVREN
jgi:hypothetical protein